MNPTAARPRGAARTAARCLALGLWIATGGATARDAASEPGSRAAEAGPGRAPDTREYLHPQPAGTALLFRFEPVETEIESRVAEAGGPMIRQSGVPGLRIAPLFQFIEAPSKNRELVMRVDLGRRTSRADFELRIERFDPSGPDQARLQQAYRMLSHGLESAPADRTDLWQQKIISLRQAVTLFDLLGMQEPMLWAEFFASHFLLERLGDALSAAEGARQVQTGAIRSRQHRLVLAARQLEGRALLALAGAGAGGATFDRARQVLSAAAERAAELGYPHERALALFHSGLAYESERNWDQAFDRFGAALDTATAAGDSDFANAVRRHAAALHERLGNTDAALAMMQAIDTGSPPAGPAAGPAAAPAPGERDSLRYRYEQGRLLHKTYRHEEAIVVLRQALAQARAAPQSDAAGPVGLLLGQALFHAGRFEEAATLLLEAIPSTAAANHAEELRDAWSALAAIYRSRGEWDAVRAMREQQERFTRTPDATARLAYDRAVDLVSGEGPVPDEALDLFRSAAAEARRAGLDGLAALSRLHHCAAGGTCAELPEIPDVTWPASSPADRFEARRLQVLILERRGSHAAALAAAEDLLSDVLFHESRLPGVLGAWYALQRDAVYDAYARLQIRSGSPAGRNAAARTLAALDAMRSLRGPGATAPADAAGTAGRLRSLMAAREAGDPASGSTTAITGAMAALRETRRDGDPHPDIDSRTRRLLDHLGSWGPDRSLLAYYVANDRAYAWIGTDGGVERVPLRWSREATETLVRLGLAVREQAVNRDASALAGSLERLGELLAGPLAGRFTDEILFLPLGLLQGVPLDGLIVNGRPLAQRHRIINLGSLESLGRPDRSLALSPTGSTGPLRAFVAGNRKQGSGDFNVSTPPSEELRAVTDHFVGPGLTVRQGAALQWDEFQDPRFGEAQIVHLAVPAVEDLAEPAGAHLLMSDNAPDPERLVLWIDDLPPLDARLAVLSQATFGGRAGSPLGQRGGLVGGFLAAGADTVVASLWPVGDSAAAAFIDRFYGALQRGGDPVEALFRTKREALADGPAALPVWPAFQVFID